MQRKQTGIIHPDQKPAFIHPHSDKALAASLHGTAAVEDARGDRREVGGVNITAFSRDAGLPLSPSLTRALLLPPVGGWEDENGGGQSNSSQQDYAC